MAYFNHAFTKIFLGIGETIADPATDYGFIKDGDVPMGAPNATDEALSNLPPGYFGVFDPKTYETISQSPGNLTGCCPVMFAASSILSNDKIGKFHGGYRETNKSKIVNPKYVQAAYGVYGCQPVQAVVSIGVTPQTDGDVPTPEDNFQSGTTISECQKDYLCGETYYLRIDIKGSPALRALNHNAYQTLSAYTGCCAGPTPTVVDPTLVYIEWAKALVINNYLNPFILPIVFDTTGAPWYAPGTTSDPLSGALVTSAQWWDAYVSPGGPYTGATAGMRLIGAYVDTKFLDCTFQLTDFFEKEPVRIYASLVDYNGDPCTFDRLCVYNDCRGLQGMGFGEQVVRDLILSQSYLQNFFHSDLRIREITQGNQMLNAGGLSRNALYTRYFLLHSVPRFNNPTGVFDNDRYMLEFIAPIGGISTFETFLSNWLKACANCTPFEAPAECAVCEIEPNEEPVPVP